MVTTDEAIEELERQLLNDGDILNQANTIFMQPAFHKAISTAILTAKDKLAAESMGRESDLLNRGVMAGASLVMDIIRRSAAAYKMANMTSELAEDDPERFKTV